MEDTTEPMPSGRPNDPSHGVRGHVAVPPRSARHLLLFAGPKNPRTWWLIGGVAVAGVVAVLCVIAFTDLDWRMVQRGMERLNAAMERLRPAAVIPLMALLPIVGFPIAIVYLVAGARFGPIVGGLVVAGVTAVHLVGSHYIARSFLRGPLERWIAKRHRRLPEVPADEQVMVCVIGALVPGLPYVVRNYLLALAGVRLKVFFSVCLPIYVARSYVTILLGNLSNDPTGRGLIILVIVDVLKVAICAFVIWRLRVHHRKFHRPADAGEPLIENPS